LIETFNIGIVNFEWYEWFLIPFILFGFYVYASNKMSSKIKEYPEYKYLVPGLALKLIGGAFFGIIYIFYYGGGDTVNYYSSAIPLQRLFNEDVSSYFAVIFDGEPIWESATYINSFTAETKSPLFFIASDPKTFSVCKFTSPLLILTFGSYFATTLLLAGLTFFSQWRLYRMFVKIFPSLYKELALAILFIPSVAFWGSGIMKDTFTYAATCLAVSSFYYAITNHKRALNVVLLLFAFWMILSMKPYILNLLIPCCGLWFVFISTSKVKSVFVKSIVFPVLFVLGLGGSYLILSSLGGSMDKFALDTAIQTSQITSEDLQRSAQYGDNSFEIAQIDGSVGSLLAVMPTAMVAGLYRPFFFEARSVVMLFSALENLVLLALTLLLIYKFRIGKIVALMKAFPVLWFCLSFSILFAFMIGVTTPNFGALVRFKIPLIPFFTVFLVVIWKSERLMLPESKRD
jgi:hypothetical protein